MSTPSLRQRESLKLYLRPVVDLCPKLVPRLTGFSRSDYKLAKGGDTCQNRESIPNLESLLDVFPETVMTSDGYGSLLRGELSCYG